MVFQVSLDSDVPWQRQVLERLMGSPTPSLASVSNKPLEDFVRHLLSTESGKQILIPAAQHWKVGDGWTRDDMRAKTGIEDAMIQKFIRILGRPINSPSTNPTQIPLWDFSDDKYRLTADVHAEILRQIGAGTAPA